MGIFDKPNIKKMKAKKDVKGLIKAMKHKEQNVCHFSPSLYHSFTIIVPAPLQ